MSHLLEEHRRSLLFIGAVWITSQQNFPISNIKKKKKKTYLGDAEAGNAYDIVTLMPLKF